MCEGFGNVTISNKPKSNQDFVIPQNAQDQMRKSAMVKISTEFGTRLPVLLGKDQGLPKNKPIFDLAEMEKRNIDLRKQKAVERAKSRVG